MTSAPATPAVPSKLQTILSIIQLALTGLATLVPGAALAETFVTIFQNATQLYQQESGQPFDVTKIPLETPVA